MAKFHCVHRQPILPQTSTSLTFVRSLMTDGPSMRLLHFLRKLRKLLQVALAPTGGLQYVTRYRIVPCTAAKEDFKLLTSSLAKYKKIQAIRLGPVTNDKSLTTFIKALQETNWKLIKIEEGLSYTSNLLENFELFRKTLAAKKIKKINYYERKLKKDYDTFIQHYKLDSTVDWENVIDDLITIEHSSWVSKTGEPRFIGDKNRNFWLSVLSSEKTASLFNVWIIYANKKPISFCFTFRIDNELHILANSYDEDFSSYSTGSILYRDVFIYAHENPIISKVNIGRGNSGYKSTWRAEPSDVIVDWIAFPPTISGRCFYFLTKLKRALRK